MKERFCLTKRRSIETINFHKVGVSNNTQNNSVIHIFKFEGLKKLVKFHSFVDRCYTRINKHVYSAWFVFDTICVNKYTKKNLTKIHIC